MTNSLSDHPVGNEPDGLFTYATRVEQWECDFNGHWNTRYYGFAFDQAAAVADSLSGPRPDSQQPVEWHLRFHRELAAAASVRVLSFRAALEVQAHQLFGVEGLSATALRSGFAGNALPDACETVLASVNPRGLTEPFNWTEMQSAGPRAIPLGTIAKNELDVAGRLSLGNMLVYCGRGSYMDREAIGLGPEFTRETGIAFMLVEMRARLLPGCVPGVPLRMVSRIGPVKAKSFISRHRIENYCGAPAATIEMCLVAVDMASRKAVEVPGLLHGVSREQA